GGERWLPPGSPQRLIGVDVADAADDRLVHDRRLERNAPPLQPPVQLLGGEPPRQRLGSDLLLLEEGGDLSVGQQRQACELTDVGEVKRGAIVEVEDHVAGLVRQWRGPHRDRGPAVRQLPSVPWYIDP